MAVGVGPGAGRAVEAVFLVQVDEGFPATRYTRSVEYMLKRFDYGNGTGGFGIRLFEGEFTG